MLRREPLSLAISVTFGSKQVAGKPILGSLTKSGRIGMGVGSFERGRRQESDKGHPVRF